VSKGKKIKKALSGPRLSHYDICILGGGASGLVAAIKAGEVGGASILILEKNRVFGHKVAASGNGRCNLSNKEAVGWPETRIFFESIGVFTKTDSEGRVYPMSESGVDVSHALVRACKKSGVELIAEAEVKKVRVQRSSNGENQFIIYINDSRQFTCRRLLMAMGGKAAPRLGTCGDGYRIARELGHRINRTFPILTGIETEEDMEMLNLAGLREKAEVSLYRSGNMIFSEKGEVQFYKEGLSGICIFNMTRYMDIEGERSINDGFSDFEISIDFAPDWTYEEAERKILEGIKREDGNAVEALCSIVKRSLAELIGENKISPAPAWEQIKSLRFHPKNLRGWDRAQLTRGGIPLSEVNKETLESRLIQGLYFAGEILDRDGPCGGFNLQMAWSDGFKAGYSIRRDL
jgi:predicted Rossmann fold flavoprotein